MSPVISVYEGNTGGMLVSDWMDLQWVWGAGGVEHGRGAVPQVTMRITPALKGRGESVTRNVPGSKNAHTASSHVVA